MRGDCLRRCSGERTNQHQRSGRISVPRAGQTCQQGAVPEERGACVAAAEHTGAPRNEGCRWRTVGWKPAALGRPEVLRVTSLAQAGIRVGVPIGLAIRHRHPSSRSRSRSAIRFGHRGRDRTRPRKRPQDSRTATRVSRPQADPRATDVSQPRPNPSLFFLESFANGMSCSRRRRPGGLARRLPSEPDGYKQHKLEAHREVEQAPGRAGGPAARQYCGVESEAYRTRKAGREPAEGRPVRACRHGHGSGDR